MLLGINQERNGEDRRLIPREHACKGHEESEQTLEERVVTCPQAKTGALKGLCT
jgi:hypothetical protein